jgi:hypothetical protein
MQFQTEARETFTQSGQESLGLGAAFESHDEVVRVAHDDHVAAHSPLPPPLDPKIEHVMQVQVGQ